MDSRRVGLVGRSAGLRDLSAENTHCQRVALQSVCVIEQCTNECTKPDLDGAIAAKLDPVTESPRRASFAEPQPDDGIVRALVRDRADQREEKEADQRHSHDSDSLRYCPFARLYARTNAFPKFV